MSFHQRRCDETCGRACQCLDLLYRSHWDGSARGTPSLLWLATIQGIERKQDLAGLAPKDCFIPAKPVEWETRQIDQKATCEIGGGINGFQLRVRPRLGYVMSCDPGPV